MGCTESLLLAAALIAQPAFTPPPPHVPGKFCRMYSLACEVLDPRERHWLEPADYYRNLGWLSDLRTWHKNLAGAPSLLEAERWPPYSVASYYYDANQRHARWLYETLSVLSPYDHRRCVFEGWIEENRELGAVWSAVHQARNPANLVCSRRIALAGLRDTLSWEDWVTGRLPCALPLHRFARRD